MREDGVVANILCRAEQGSGYRQVCSICQQKFKSNKQAYAHIKTHGDAVRVQRIETKCIDKETTIASNKIIDPSNARASAENGCVTRMCLQSYATAIDVTEVNDNGGVVEGLQDGSFDLDCIDAGPPNEYDWNESDEVGETGERSMDQFPPDSALDEGDHAIEAEDELCAPFISHESIAERIATVAYAIANTTRDYTMNEDILRSSLSSTFEDLQRGEDNNLETDVRDDYGIAFQEECLTNMCRAADLAGIGQHNNALDESEFDIEEVAKELSLPVDPDNPRSISLGQYCIDQLMIMQVISPYVVISIRLKTRCIYAILAQ
jgi:hypothetical protein